MQGENYRQGICFILHHFPATRSKVELLYMFMILRMIQRKAKAKVWSIYQSIDHEVPGKRRKLLFINNGKYSISQRKILRSNEDIVPFTLLVCRRHNYCSGTV